MGFEWENCFYLKPIWLLLFWKFIKMLKLLYKFWGTSIVKVSKTNRHTETNGIEGNLKFTSKIKSSKPIELIVLVLEVRRMIGKAENIKAHII